MATGSRRPHLDLFRTFLDAVIRHNNEDLRIKTGFVYPRVSRGGPMSLVWPLNAFICSAIFFSLPILNIDLGITIKSMNQVHFMFFFIV